MIFYASKSTQVQDESFLGVSVLLNTPQTVQLPAYFKMR